MRIKIRTFFLLFFVLGLATSHSFDFSGLISELEARRQGFILSTKGEQARAALARAEERCSREGDRTQGILCIRRNLEGAVKKFGVQALMKSLARILSESKNIDALACHDIAHAIGQVGGMHSNGLTQTLASCTSLCGSGCQHGVIEAYLAQGKELAEVIPDICRSLPEEKKQAECYHGLGHGVATVAGANILEALSLCDLVPQEKGRLECGGGVIMELYAPSSFDHPILSFPPNIAEFCSTLPGVYSESCYLVSGLYEYARSEDIEDAFQECQAVPGVHQFTCMDYLGQTIYEHNGRSVGRTLLACESFGSWESACLAGALRAIILADPRVRNGFELCKNSREDLQDECFSLLGEKIEVAHGTPKREELCSGLLDEHKGYCLKD